MKQFCRICLLLILGISIILENGCKKDEKNTSTLAKIETSTLAKIETSNVSNTTYSTATSGGNISSDGGSPVSARGVCWGTTSNPTTSQDTKTSNGSGIGNFVSNLAGLTAGTTYHVRAYATNSVGTSYGDDVSFLTLGQAPSCLTQDATNITTTSATLNGTVNANDLSTTVTFEYGVTTSYGSTPTATQSPVTGNTIKNISADISGLLSGTTYHFRVKTVNSIGTTYSEDKTFTTLGQAPTATTLAATNIVPAGATLNGTVNANNLSTTVSFEYGTTTSYGSSVTASQSPVTGTSPANFSANISGLTLGTTYYFRVKAVNSIGTTYGSVTSFTTPNLPRVYIPTSATSITSNSAIIGGAITSDGGSPIIAKGVCWNTTGNPTLNDNKTNDGSGTDSYQSTLTGLTQLTRYYVRAYATNIVGTAYETGYTNNFLTTYGYLGTVTDIDNNSYRTTKIGSQVWMADNLKTSKYSDGTPIPLVTANSIWAGLTTPCYCNGVDGYGYLYNGYAVKKELNGNKNICPIGWHVPISTEWETMINYLIANSYNYDGTTTGNKIARALASEKPVWSTSYLYRSDGAIASPVYSNDLRNKSGFTAVQDGIRYAPDATLSYDYGEYWSNTISSYYVPSLNTYSLTAETSGLGYGLRIYLEGAAIRCLKD